MIVAVNLNQSVIDWDSSLLHAACEVLLLRKLKKERRENVEKRFPKLA